MTINTQASSYGLWSSTGHGLVCYGLVSANGFGYGVLFSEPSLLYHARRHTYRADR